MRVIRASCIVLVGILLSAVTVNADEARAAGKTAEWQSVADEFFKQLDVYEMKPAFLSRCVGMAVTPAGEVFIVASKGHGVCVSKDQGATWSVVADNKVTGRCETGFGFSIAYPYDGRLAFFCIDGTGGISLDGGKTWRPFAKLLRMFDYADVDWNARDSQTIFGLLHEPFYTVLSTDGGRNWRQIYKDAEAPQEVQRTTSKYHLGMINADTLVRSHRDQDGISISTDAGKTWSQVAKYKILGRRPVHYGKRVYWTAADGVVVTENGRDWTLLGKGPENAVYGPYFGTSEQEMMVVSDKAFFVSRDGGQTWKNVAAGFSPPEGPFKGFHASGSFNYYGWDAKNDLLYASGLGGSVYQLKLKP